MAYLVCHIEVDSAARHCIRRTVVEVVENSRMAAGEEGVAGSHSRFEEEEDRSSAVAVVVPRILRGIQLLGNLTCLCVRVVELEKGTGNCFLSA